MFATALNLDDEIIMHDGLKKSPGLKLDAVVSRKSKASMNKSFFCKLCKQIMLQVFQLVCGHLVCGYCKKSLDDRNLKVCPDDTTCSVNVSKSMKIFEDKCQTRTIQNFIVECVNTPFGCSWSGELISYIDHYEKCPSHQENAPQKIKGLPSDARIIYKIENASLPANFSEKKKESLKTSLTPTVINCLYCQWKGDAESELENHLSLDCENAELSCPFKDVGCPYWQPQKRVDLEEHTRVGSEIHLELLLKDYLSLRRSSMDEFDALFSIKKKWASLEENFKRISIDMISLKDKMEARFHDVENQISCLRKEIGNQSSASCKKDLKRMETRLSDIEAMLSCFQEDRMVRPMGENFEERLSKIEAKVKSQETLLGIYEKEIQFKNARMDSLEQQIIGTGVTSYDGTLLWRIDDFTRKRHDAITKKRTYILSPPFFSGPRGYKMCMRVYLNGDGQGKGTHVSVFFTLLKGPFDPILPWPFTQVVRIAILNQRGGKNVENSFQPDASSVSFQRPKKEANISSGCPAFLPLSALDSEGFVSDDCVFFKTVVEGFSL